MAKQGNDESEITQKPKPDKTITVQIEITRRHPTYEKVVRRTSTVHAHDERNQAQEGDIVRVKPGYARNYLLPRGFAYEATAGNRKRIEQERQRLEQAEEQRRRHESGGDSSREE